MRDQKDRKGSPLCPGTERQKLTVKGICGSDVHFYNTGRMGLVSCDAPMCLGHEAAGIIVQLGSNIAAQAADADAAAAELAKVQANANGSGTTGKAKPLPKKVLRLGDRVALEPGVTCRMCDDCRGGRYQVRHLFFAAASCSCPARSQSAEISRHTGGVPRPARPGDF